MAIIWLHNEPLSSATQQCCGDTKACAFSLLYLFRFLFSADGNYEKKNKKQKSVTLNTTYYDDIIIYQKLGKNTASAGVTIARLRQLTFGCSRWSLIHKIEAIFNTIIPHQQPRSEKKIFELQNNFVKNVASGKVSGNVNLSLIIIP